MSSQIDPTGPPKKRRSRVRSSFLLLSAILCGVILGTYLWIQYVPNWRHQTPDFAGNPKPVFYQGRMLDQPASGEKESLRLPFELVKEHLDPMLAKEEKTHSVIITTQDKVLRMQTNQLTAVMNEKPFTMKFPLEKQGEGYALPMEPLKLLYSVELRESPETGAVLMLKEGELVRWGKTAAMSRLEATIPMRSEPTIKAPILTDLKQGVSVMIWGEEGEWARVQLPNGYTGYVKLASLTDLREEIIPKQAPTANPIQWKPPGGKINLTWEQVFEKNPDTAKIPAMPGLNVISPTWFHIADGQGNLKNVASAAYVKWAHDRGYQVWGLFSNGFEPKQTTEALSTYDRRMSMIKQLLGFAQMYKLDGINIDFENVYTADKQNLVQFVREMTPLMHEQGLVVSIDVTPKSNTELWSAFFDRAALIQSVDYMMVMTYDEHWASSPKSGSVASLPWVEKSVQQLLREDKIPPQKLVLGVPFYTRIWTEEVKDGKTKVTSRSIFMDTAKRMVKEKSLTPQFQSDTGQNYVEYTEDGKLNRIWLEDETSVKARIDVVEKYNLAGIASWRRGYESPDLWEFIRTHMNK
jgi:spore germination protein YaaH